MKKVLAAVAVILVIVVGAVLVVLGNVNEIVKTSIEVAGPEILKAPVEVAEVDISFLSGTGLIRGLEVGNPEGYEQPYAFYMDSLAVEVDPRSLTSDKILVRDITIDSPSIIFEGGFGDNNLTQLQSNAEDFATVAEGFDAGEDEAPVADSGAQPSIQIDHLALKDANIGIALSFLGDETLSVTLPSMEMVDIGKDEDMNASDVLQEVLGSLNRSVLPLVRDSAGDIQNQLKEKGEQLKESVGEGVKKLKNLFNRN